MQLDSADTAPVPARRRFAPVLDRDWLLALALAFAVGVTVWFGRSIKEFFAPSAASVFTPSTSTFSVSSSSDSLPGSTSTMPRDANIQPTLPVSPRLPSLRLNRKRSSDAVRLRLSVAASTITATPAGP